MKLRCKIWFGFSVSLVLVMVFSVVYGGEKKLNANEQNKYFFRTLIPEHPYGLGNLPFEQPNRQGSAYFADTVLSKAEKEKKKPYSFFAKGKENILSNEQQMQSIAQDFQTTEIYAFLIGNETHGSSHSLVSPKNNVHAMRRLLIDVLHIAPSNVKTLLNVSSSVFVREWKDWARRLPEDALIIFYYSGYGNLSGMPWFVDASKAMESDVWRSSFEHISNDMLFLLDMVGQEGKASIPLQNERVSDFGSKNNVAMFHSQAQGQYVKDNVYVFMRHFYVVLYSGIELLREWGIPAEKCGLWTTMLLSVFGDFLWDVEARSSFWGLNINGVFHAMQDKYNRLEESGTVLIRPIKIPMLAVNFRYPKNVWFLSKQRDIRDFKAFGDVVSLPRSNQNGEAQLSLWSVLDVPNVVMPKLPEEDYYLVSSHIIPELVDVDVVQFPEIYFLDKRGKKNALQDSILLNQQGNKAARAGDYGKAYRYYKMSLFLKTKVKYWYGVANTRCNMGLVFLKQGNYIQANNMFASILELISNEKLCVDNPEFVGKLHYYMAISYIGLNKKAQFLLFKTSGLNMLKSLSRSQSHVSYFFALKNLKFQNENKDITEQFQWH